MPLFKFVGAYATFYGSGLPTASGSGMVNPGDEVELDSTLSPFWVTVEGDSPASDPVVPDSPPAAPAAVSGPSEAISETTLPQAVPADEPDLFRH